MNLESYLAAGVAHLDMQGVTRIKLGHIQLRELCMSPEYMYLYSLNLDCVAMWRGIPIELVDKPFYIDIILEIEAYTGATQRL